MIYYALGAAAFLLMKPKQTSTTVSRPKTPTLDTQRPQKGKNPASAQAPRQDRGNTSNQPWYTGPLLAGGGMNLRAAVNSFQDLSSLFQSDFLTGGPDLENTDLSIPDGMGDAVSDSDNYPVDPDPSGDMDISLDSTDVASWQEDFSIA